MSVSNQEKAQKIIDHLKASKANRVAITNQYTHMVLSGKDLEKFEKAGCELIVGKDSGLYVRRGKKLDCVSYCKIQFGRVA